MRVMSLLAACALFLPVAAYMVLFSNEIFSNEVSSVLSGSCVHTGQYQLACGPEVIYFLRLYEIYYCI